MPRQRYQGFEDARDAGLLDGSPDLRVHLVGAAFDASVDAVHMSDIATLDEFDGANYAPYDAANVQMGWAAGERVWTCDNGAGNEFGTGVGQGSGVMPAAMVVRLRVDGDPDNDYLLAWSSDGMFSDGNGSDMGLVLPNDILLFSRNAVAD